MSCIILNFSILELKLTIRQIIRFPKLQDVFNLKSLKSQNLNPNSENCKTLLNIAKNEFQNFQLKDIEKYYRNKKKINLNNTKIEI